MLSTDFQILPLRLGAFIFETLPGISKVVLFFREEKNTRSVAMSDGENPLLENCDEHLASRLNPLFKSKNPWEWMSAGDLPYEFIQSTYIQRTVFSEENNRVLLLRHAIDDVGQNILVFVHFPEHFQWSGKDRQQPVFTTDHKSLVSFILYHAIARYLAEGKANDGNRQKVATAFKNLGAQLAAMRNEAVQMLEQGNQWKMDTIRFFADEISSGSAMNLTIDVSAMNLLMKSQASPNELKMMLSRASETASVTTPPDAGEVVVYDYHLMASPANDQKVTETKIVKGTDRTLALLDRFELAAGKVVELNETLTGQNIGRCCTPPISAPAVSDAIKKHRQRIGQLLLRYPDRWMLLRNHFKPIQNQLSHKKSSINSQTA